MAEDREFNQLIEKYDKLLTALEETEKYAEIIAKENLNLIKHKERLAYCVGLLSGYIGWDKKPVREILKLLEPMDINKTRLFRVLRLGLPSL